MSALVPQPTSAINLPAETDDPCICKRPPSLERRLYGINQIGELYEYGETAAKPKRVLAADDGLIYVQLLGAAIAQRAGRDYLELTLQSPVPLLLLSLNLPCYSNPTQWHVRSLLGAMLQASACIDLSATAGKLLAKLGTGGKSGRTANFMELFLDAGDHYDPEIRWRRIDAKAIEGDRDSLEIAVNHLRRALGHEPQFL